MSSLLDDLKLQYKIGGITHKLIYWNVGLFLISLFFYNFKFSYFQFPSWLALSSDPRVVLYHPWTLVTYSFLHDGFWHLFFNMMVLQFSGQLFLTFFTQKQLLGLYFLSSLFAGLVFVSSFYFFSFTTLLVGASGAIMAVLMATTTYQPLMNVRLLIFGNVKLWMLTGIILLLDIMQVQSANFGGHIAHLAGAFFGFIYVKLLLNGLDLSDPINGIIDFICTPFNKKKKNPFRKIHVNPKKPSYQKSSQIITKDKQQQQIDEILDKISKSGYDSLTSAEKEFLFKAGQ